MRQAIQVRVITTRLPSPKSVETFVAFKARGPPARHGARCSGALLRPRPCRAAACRAPGAAETQALVVGGSAPRRGGRHLGSATFFKGPTSPKEHSGLCPFFCVASWGHDGLDEVMHSPMSPASDRDEAPGQELQECSYLSQVPTTPPDLLHPPSGRARSLSPSFGLGPGRRTVHMLDNYVFRSIAVPVIDIASSSDSSDSDQPPRENSTVARVPGFSK